MKVLILGTSGMLGHAMLHVLSKNSALDVYGSMRSGATLKYFPPHLAKRIHLGVNVDHLDDLIQLFTQVRPDVLINCVGVVKQLAAANDPIHTLPINSLLPHRLARLCELTGARLIHISTDCVFSGQKGCYLESDTPDATDLYGRSKLLGEVDYPHAVTLRTSIIGHELATKHSLVDWFLAQSEPISGYTKAIFSGLPTIELARVINAFVLPNSTLHGLYHVAAKPIAKYDLLQLVNTQYSKNLQITPSSNMQIDRSLNAEKFQLATGYTAKEWTVLIKEMHQSFLENQHA